MVDCPTHLILSIVIPSIALHVDLVDIFVVARKIEYACVRTMTVPSCMRHGYLSGMNRGRFTLLCFSFERFG